MNFLAILTATTIPLLIGYIWYNPKVFGGAWKKATNFREEKNKNNSMLILTFILSFFFSFLVSFILQTSVIHQFQAMSLVGGANGLDHASDATKSFFSEYSHAFRTFKHGVFHGTLMGILFVFPIIAVNALFEQKSWSYILINAGYWTLSLGLMGGILCGWE